MVWWSFDAGFIEKNDVGELDEPPKLELEALRLSSKMQEDNQETLGLKYPEIWKNKYAE